MQAHAIDFDELANGRIFVFGLLGPRSIVHRERGQRRGAQEGDGGRRREACALQGVHVKPIFV